MDLKSIDGKVLRDYFNELEEESIKACVCCLQKLSSLRMNSTCICANCLLGLWF